MIQSYHFWVYLYGSSLVESELMGLIDQEARIYVCSISK